MASQNSQNSLGNAWELSLYELHRKPHEMVSDTSAIAVSPRSLHSELMCPICLDLMQNTQTTKECLHRFCQECIITALRSGNKECPTCRKKLVSKRSLRPDPNFDKLIAKIYPNREELNAAEQEKQVNRKSYSLHRRKRKADSPPTEAGRSELDGQGGKRRKVDEEDVDGSVTPPPSNDSSSSEQVELQLRPHPQQNEVHEFTIKTLVTSPLCTVSHLIRYIGINLASQGKGEARGDYNLHAQVGEDYVCLPVSTTLRQIEDMYSEYSGGKLKLYFTACNERALASPHSQ